MLPERYCILHTWLYSTETLSDIEHNLSYMIPASLFLYDQRKFMHFSSFPSKSQEVIILLVSFCGMDILSCELHIVDYLQSTLVPVSNFLPVHACITSYRDLTRPCTKGLTWHVKKTQRKCKLLLTRKQHRVMKQSQKRYSQ